MSGPPGSLHPYSANSFYCHRNDSQRRCTRERYLGERLPEGNRSKGNNPGQMHLRETYAGVFDEDIEKGLVLVFSGPHGVGRVVRCSRCLRK